MASGSITSWQIEGQTMETVRDFVFLGSRITADGDCSHEIKRCLLLGRKAMTNLDNILKSRDITWLTKVRLLKAMVFPVVMYGCESWIVKKAEHQRIDAFELWCWRRVLWNARRSVLDVHWKYWCWSWNSKTPILQYFGHLMQRVDSFEDPDVGEDWRQEEKGTTEDEMVGWHHQLNGRGFGWTPGVADGQGVPVCCGSWGHKSSYTTQRLNWTELSKYLL